MTTLTFKLFGIRFTLTNERSVDARYDAVVGKLSDDARRNPHVMQRLCVLKRALLANDPNIEQFEGAVLRAAQ